MSREDGTKLFVEVPLSCIRFIDPLEQRKFEKRLANDEDKTRLIQEIESLLHKQTLGIATY